jgi:hypothetical protein
LASLQLIEATTESGDLYASSIVGACHPEAVETGVRGNGALMSAESPLLADAAGRFVWTDRDQWRLENVLLPAGVTLARVSWNSTLGNRPFIKATLTEQGIQGQLDSSLLHGGQDAMMAAPGAPNLAVAIDSNGVFAAGADQTLEPGQFVQSQLVDDRRNRRQRLYRELLTGDRPHALVDRPTLLFWASPMKPPMALGETQQNVGEALVLAPLVLARPQPGSSVVIPSLLIPWQAVSGPDGTPVTSAYSNVERRWVDGLVAATRITLRFQMPAMALPLKIQRATFYLDVTAPSRNVSIVGWNRDQPVPLTTRSSPVGARLAVSVDDPSLTGLDDRGGLRLNINVGRHPREEVADLAQSGWRIDRAWLDVNEALIEQLSQTLPSARP